MAKKYYWEYFRNRKDGKLNRVHSKMLNEKEVQDYIKSNWLQADLMIYRNGTISEIGSITTKNIFLVYNKKTKSYSEIPIHRISEWLLFEKEAIMDGWY